MQIIYMSICVYLHVIYNYIIAVIYLYRDMYYVYLYIHIDVIYIHVDVLYIYIYSKDTQN